MLALRRAEFQKRIAMLASEKASDEIARLRQEQEVELAQMKLQMLLEIGIVIVTDEGRVGLYMEIEDFGIKGERRGRSSQ